MNRAMLLAVILVAGCAESAPQPPAEEPEQLVPALAAADSAAAITQGGEVATAVAQGLVQRLQARLQADGAAGAVDFCSRTALVLTDSLLANYPAATAVRRTSPRIRNPENAPDALEQAALAWFESARTATGTLPPELVQLAGEGEVRYYRPLVMLGFCTQCHGAVDAIDPAVRQILAERYPNDQATGYAEGDFRGVIRVSLRR